MTTHSSRLADADRHFQTTLNIGIDELLAPIDTSMPSGRPARDCPSYNQIAHARRHDDPSLPMGAWQRDLKRADWLTVSHLIAQTLIRQSKDMQLLAWLYEAQINQYGIAGIAPAVVLFSEMSTRYWDQIHPGPSGGYYEHRANIIRSMSDKNLAALRLAPLIQRKDGNTYCWADWERAHHYERARASGRHDPASEDATLAQLQEALDATSASDLLELRGSLSNGQQSIVEMSATLDPRFEGDAPSLQKTVDLLETIRSLFDGELHKRGVQLEPSTETEPLVTGVESVDTETSAAQPAVNVLIANGTPEAPNVAAAIRDRADAYARLDEIAELLLRIEPHSPVPYLVRRAALWGRMSTTELYQELFIRLGGQLSIFEMVGIEHPDNAGEQGSISQG